MSDTERKAEWQNPSIAQSMDMLQKVHAVEPVTRYGSDSAMALMPLDFYGADAWLLRIQKPQVQSPPQHYVILPQEAIPLDGSVANIHVANAAAPLALDARNIEHYLAFRLYFGDGRVMLRARAEQIDDAWQATLRAQDKTGTYEITVMVSGRGEISENHKEQRSEDTLSQLPPFALTA